MPNLMELCIITNHTSYPAKVLREELMSSNTALPLLLFIAQIRSRILFGDNKGDSSNLKLTGHLFDTAQDLLMQVCYYRGDAPPCPLFCWR